MPLYMISAKDNGIAVCLAGIKELLSPRNGPIRQTTGILVDLTATRRRKWPCDQAEV